MSAVQLNLALANAMCLDGLRAAMGALIHLDDAGCTVREIDIRNRRPVIRITPPPAGCWLRGALRRRVTQGGSTRTVYATTCHGAQVEWETCDSHRPQAARA